jgi:hypothetical protein
MCGWGEELVEDEGGRGYVTYEIVWEGRWELVQKLGSII